MAGLRFTSVARVSGLAGLFVAALAQGHAADAPRPPEGLSFEQRVAAQRAIERVYFRHRTGATAPFERAVPEFLLARKVRTYLRQSVALEEFWHTPVASADLGRELRRIAAGSHFPERLAEIRAALGNDEVLLRETLARPILVDRLARAFLSADVRVQERPRREAESLRRALLEGRLDPEGAHPRRTVLVVRRNDRPDAGASARGRKPAPGLTLDPDGFERWRRLQPETPGQIGPLVEGRDAFEFSVILSEEGGTVTLATYTVPKVTWDEWWAMAAGGFDESRAPQATPEDPLIEEPRNGEAVAAGTSTSSTAACEVQDLWSGGRREALPEPRYEHTAVWTGSEMIVWGGRWDAGILDNGSRYDPATDTWTPISTTGGPAARWKHTAVWTGASMVVWGGDLGGAQTNTGGRYDPVADTWQPTSTLDAPSGRYYHTAVWTGREMIVWGGGISQTNTGGRYDPIADTWRPTSTLNAPSPRIEHTAVWSGREMVVWGGSYTNTGGRYDPSTDIWTPTSTLDAPVPRSVHTAVWTGSRMIVWGSFGSGYSPTGRRYDPATDTWSPTALAGAPTNRYRHTAIWTGTEMIVWGGTDFSHSPPNPALNTGGRYDPDSDSWRPTATLNAPSPRSGHTSVWTGRLMIVWGAGTSTGGRYEPDSDSWTPTRSSRESPGPRATTTSVWTGNEILIWGGGDFPGNRYDATTDSWSVMTTVGAPSPRSRAPVVWTGTEMIVWGGGEYERLATGARYDPASDAWTPTSETSAPAARSGHSAVWTGTEMIVWGGWGASGLLNDGGLYIPASDTWSPTPLTRSPEPMTDHRAIWTGTEMIVWGGNVGSGVYTNAGWRLEPPSGTWKAMSLTGAPLPGYGYSAVWTGTEMIVWGGGGGSIGGRYDPSTDTWTRTSTAGAPEGRWAQTAIWTGAEMIVWGGFELDFNFYAYAVDTGGRYDPKRDTWMPTTTIGAAFPRFDHLAVWTGRAMIVWGGQYFVGDVSLTVDDRSVRWYGSAAAAPPADRDGDGAWDCSDCDDANAAAWAAPGEATDLAFMGDGTTLTWSPAPGPGAASVGYDTLRSESTSDFVTPAVCVETNDADTLALDADEPPPGGVFFYLVRPRNACPGASGYGSLGRASSGAPRTARGCP